MDGQEVELPFEEYAATVPMFGPNVTWVEFDAWVAQNETAEIGRVLDTGSATSLAEQEQLLRDLDASSKDVAAALERQQKGFTRAAASFQGVGGSKKADHQECKNYAYAEMYRRASLCYSNC